MDSFFGIGIFELFLIAVIALVVMGPERLPGAMRTLAGYMRQIRNISSELTSQFSEEIKMLEELDPRRMVNEVLDPTKTPAPTNKTPLAKPTPAKPTAANNAAKSTTAATAAAKPAPKANEEGGNSILPPKDAAPANGVDQPIAATGETKIDTSPVAVAPELPVASAATDATTPAEAVP
jgi:sec-independent protein translocase protein TatB